MKTSWNSLQIEQVLRSQNRQVRRLDSTRVVGDGLVWFEVRSPRTTARAKDSTRDKQVTRNLLEQAGVATPRGFLCVPAHAAEAAERLGWPVAVKPSHGSKGAGVTTDIRNLFQLERAVFASKQLRPKQELVVEQSISGAHYRVLWAGNEACSVVHCRPWRAVGDGRRTVQQLIDEENRRRVEMLERPFLIVPGAIMRELLERQGLSLDAIPTEGREVDIAYSMNLRQGAISDEVTHLPRAQEVADVARRATLAIPGLHHSSVDLVDDGETIWVIEVNANPGLGAHLFPYEGEAQEGIVDRLVNRVYA